MEKLPPGKPGPQPIAGMFQGGLLGWVGNLIGAGIANLVSDLFQALQGLGSFTDPNMNAIRDGQLDLNNRTDLLSPLLDYGSAYANTLNGLFNTGQLWFTNQIGPMQGCHLSGGRIILEDKGLWDIRCRVWFDSIVFQTGVVEWDIRILRPDGSIYSRQIERRDSQAIFSSTNLTSVVVPDPGYQVQIWISSMAPLRGAIGGPALNRLTVQHISRDTTIGDTGQG